MGNDALLLKRRSHFSCKQPLHSLCLRVSIILKTRIHVLSSSALHAVKEHAAKSSLGFKFAYHTQAITPAETSCLLAGLLNQFQQLLTHTDRKCVLRSEDRHKRSIRIRTMHITEQNLSESQQCIVNSMRFPFISFT